MTPDPRWHPIPPCVACGSADVLVIAPGTEPLRAPTLLDDALLSRGELCRAWCAPCATARGWPSCYAGERGRA